MSALVIDAHPNPDSLVSALASAYAEGHGDARVIRLRELDFDVHMRFGYTRRMAIEPDLADARQAIRDADHIVIATPVWWRSTPALLKGFLDRALLPQQDYRYKGSLPEGLLTGRTGRIIATSDTPGWLAPLLPDTRLDQLRSGTLALCGIKPVRMRRLGPVKQSTAEQRQAWLSQVAADGAKDAARAPRRTSPLVAA
ncbi:NAD(P)H-dependent oxidoreductase [Agrococcus beijingensis]|uniref:NAD(P)H-dependent oxidoreductase n=1 Tax=Agrococcus beijingensis TaxID=3068634 RepID=UPI0027404BFD|nr:NAD(P)H-dependent oxidoreductase [Agrococcus sp. REN33]